MTGEIRRRYIYSTIERPVLGDAALKNVGTAEGTVAAGDHAHQSAPQSPSSSLPSGIIVMWSGLKADIPDGWALCDGDNGTPNLLDRFILSVGAATEAGGTGGGTTYSHDGTAVGNHGGETIAASSTTAVKVGTSTANAAAKAHTHAIPTLTHSVTQPNDHMNVRPPYYLLCFIMKL